MNEDKISTFDKRPGDMSIEVRRGTLIMFLCINALIMISELWT